MPGQPTAQDFFGAPQTDPGAAAGAAPGGPAPSALPTAEQFFAHAQPETGAAHTTLWSSLQSAGARILNSVGYGVADNWGAEPLDLAPDAADSLRKAGILPDYQKGHATFAQTANEAVIRPAAAAADLAGRLLRAPFAAVSSAGEAISQEIKGQQPGAVRSALAAPFAAVGELSQGALEGAYGELPAEAEVGATAGTARGAAAESERMQQAARARSVGVVGEGEAGYYGAAPVTPQNVQTRAAAASEAGIEPPPPAPPAPLPDIHEVARRIDPETFEQYDALAAERDRQRQTLSDLGAEREKAPEALQAQADIDEILGGRSRSFTERAQRLEAVRASAPDAVISRLDEAQARLDDALTTDTPQMVEARNKLMDADFAMRDLSPTVSQAYRQASDLMPEAGAEVAKPAEAPAKGDAETPAAETAKPQAAVAEEAPTGQAGAPEQPGPAIAAEAAAAEAQAAPPSVTGEQKLGEPAAAPGAAASGEAETPQGAARTVSPKPIEGTGDLNTRGLSEGVEAKAIEDGLTETFGDLPEYRTLSMADQAAKTAELMARDYATAKAVAMGEKLPPKGLLPESVFVGVEKRALAEGDVETLRQLATRSKLSTAATTMGQRIRALGEREQASPVSAILDVQKAREADLAKRMDIEAAKRETVNEIRDEVRKAASKPAAWTDFVSSITCGE